MVLQLKIANTSKFFTTVVDSLHDIFTKLEIPHEIAATVNLHDHSSVYIIFTVHEGGPLPPNYIAYNFEQLITDHKWNEYFFARLNRAQEVWDYSLENVKVLASKGISASFVPMGAAPTTLDLADPPSAVSREGALFVGFFSHRRHAILQPLGVTLACEVWGKDLDALQARHVIGLNIHYYNGKTILEVTRILPLLLAGLWVISERSDDPYYDEKCKDLVTFVDSPDQFKDAIAAVLALTPEQRQAETQARLERLRTGWKYEDSFVQTKLIFETFKTAKEQQK